MRGLPTAGATVILGCILFAACATSPESGTAVERVIVVGVDGLDWRVIDPLIADGRLPNLARFIEAGARGKLMTLLPTYSPIVWETVATGKLPSKHGVTGFVTGGQGPDDRRVPFTSNFRQARAVWEILGELDRRVAVVGWWTTWPAYAVNGVMVSDRVMYNRFNLWFERERAGADLPAQTWPPELFDELVDATRMGDAIEDEFFERFLPDEPRPSFERALHDPWYEMALVYARDRAYVEILDRVLEREDWDLVAYYLNGTDIASHYFWKHLFPEEWPEPIPPEELAQRGGIIPRYYEWVDEAIAPLLDLADERTLVVVLSDHGFTTGGRPDSPNISGTHWRTAPPGVLILAGGGVGAGTEIAGARVTDVAPTLLHALGHGPARDMDGRVLPIVAEAFPERPVEFVDSYEPAGDASGPAPLETEYDEAILNRLRALGYID